MMLRAEALTPSQAWSMVKRLSASQQARLRENIISRSLWAEIAEQRVNTNLLLAVQMALEGKSRPRRKPDPARKNSRCQIVVKGERQWITQNS